MLVLRCAVLAATLLTICAGAASGRPLMRAEDRSWVYDGTVRACDDGWILGEIATAFSIQQASLWETGLRISSFEKVGEIGYRTNGADFIPRRYCSARVLFNDGKVREVKYNLIESGGFASFNTGLEFCVVGLDRNHAWSPACSAAGP